MLSLEPWAVAPLRPVDAGDGCTLWDDDLEGTRRFRPFLLLGAASPGERESRLFPEPFFSRSSVDIFGGWASWVSVIFGWPGEGGAISVAAYRGPDPTNGRSGKYKKEKTIKNRTCEVGYDCKAGNASGSTDQGDDKRQSPSIHINK